MSMKELSKKKALEGLSKREKQFYETAEDIESDIISNDPSYPPKPVYYSDLEEFVPSGAGGSMGANAMAKGLSATYKDVNEFADDYFKSKKNKPKEAAPATTKSVFQENEEKRRKKLENLFKHKGLV